jgi:uncharacterized protein (DUF427 family)
MCIEAGPLKGYCRFIFSAMNGWLEEDDPIYVHPKDPYKRVDIRRSTRAIEVAVDGMTVAKSSWAMHLFETGLPTRYYLPHGSVNWELLTPSTTVTSCPYKGDANYFDVTVNGKRHHDAIWWYKTPVLETAEVAGMVCPSPRVRYLTC